MERLTFDGNFCEIAQCRELPCQHGGSCSQRKVWERLKEYEDTGLKPDEIECIMRMVTGEAVAEASEFAGMPVARLKELAEADKDGRVMVLPCKMGKSMLDMSDIERPSIMKRIHPAVAYDSRGVVFYQPYGIFLENVAKGYIQPLSEEAEAKLKEVKKDG